MKTEPKQATAQNTRDFLDQLEWLREHAVSADIFVDVPDVKVKQFAAEARSLDLGSIHDCAEPKRLTLTAALVAMQIARALDDAADMFVRLVQKLHNHAYDALLQHQADHVERTDSLVSTLHDVTLAYRTEGTAEARLNAIGAVLEPHEATSGRNYLPILTRFYSHQRSVLFRFLERIELVSTSPDMSTVDAIRFLLAHKADRHDWLWVVRDEPREDGSTARVPEVDVSMVTEKWWPLVTGSRNNGPPTRVLRRRFEICVLTEVMQDLRSGHLLRSWQRPVQRLSKQLVTEHECRKGLVSYGERAGIPVDARTFVNSMRDRLLSIDSFPRNVRRHARFVHSEPGCDSSAARECLYL